MRGGLFYKTSLSPPLFMEVPMPSQDSERSCISCLCFCDFSIKFRKSPDSVILFFVFNQQAPMMSIAIVLMHQQAPMMQTVIVQLHLHFRYKNKYVVDYIAGKRYIRFVVFGVTVPGIEDTIFFTRDELSYNRYVQRCIIRNFLIIY